MPWRDESKQSENARAQESLRVFFENQSNQITQISTQITAIASSQEAMRNDFNAKWNELPRIYMPRQEDQARGLDGRIAALEAFRIASARELSDLRVNVQQDVQRSVNEIQKEMSESRAGIDSRAIASWVTGFFLLANIVWSVLSHFILK